MKRRAILAGLGALPIPTLAAAQQAQAPVITVIAGSIYNPEYEKALLGGLRAARLTPGQDVVVEFHWTGGTVAPVHDLVRSYLDRRVAIFVAGGGNVARAIRELTTSVPIVFATDPDPIATGLVATLGRPGGNVTGLSTQASELIAKLVELLREAVPGMRQLAVLYGISPTLDGRSTAQRDRAIAASATLGVEAIGLGIAGGADIERAFAEAVTRKVDGMVVLRDFLIDGHRDPIVALAERHRLPAIYERPDFVRAGGLMSYAPDLVDLWFRAAGFAARILRGARPAEMPVEQPVKFEFAINARSARAIGVTLPHAILLRADEVIE